MASLAPHELDNGHILDDDGICWCNPTLEVYTDNFRIWEHHFEGVSETQIVQNLNKLNMKGAPRWT